MSQPIDRRDFGNLLRERLALSLLDEQVAVLFQGYGLLREMMKDLHDGVPAHVEPAPRFSVGERN
jgi:hypothetical protein